MTGITFNIPSQILKCFQLRYKIPLKLKSPAKFSLLFLTPVQEVYFHDEKFVPYNITPSLPVGEHSMILPSEYLTAV